MDWATFSTPLGIAIVAAGGSFIAGLVGASITSWTTRSTHAARLVGDERLADKKFEFDKELAERRAAAEQALAERKLVLDRALADWKRRTELAEEVLTNVYSARDIFFTARSPHSFAGEGRTRTRPHEETDEEAYQRDVIYAPFERLRAEREFLAELHARRFRFMALFGDAAAEPFQVFAKVYNEIGFATGALMSNKRLNDRLREKYETLIGWTANEEDPVMQRIDAAVASIEAFCRPVLEIAPQ